MKARPADTGTPIGTPDTAIPPAAPVPAVHRLSGTVAGPRPVPPDGIREGTPAAAPLADDGWLDTLARDGRVVCPGFLEDRLSDALRQEVYALRNAARLRSARVGRGRERRHDAAERGDRIHWLEGATPAQRELLERLEHLRRVAARGLIPGLFETEAHFALYPPGTGYARHVDAFREGNRRRLSLVLYLNRHWRARDGGELAFYTPQDGADEARELERVRPEAGTLAIFLSQSVPHAVLPTRRWRASIACWMGLRDTASPLDSLERQSR
ncbi:SM-20-related protein [Thioalkalivibrio sp. ALE21]|nr:SM-20-related protein [Thioalkalivibrio sp. ALE21]